MAFVAVNGSNGVWQYDNAATASDTYSDAQGSVSGGIRTQTVTFAGLTRTTQNTAESTSTTFAIDTANEIMTGFVVTGTDISGTVTVTSINRGTNEVVLSSEQTIGAEHELTFTRPPSVTKTYIKCRKVGETAERGELNKDYYDQKHADGTP